MAFHAMNGWHFERMEDGGVRITKTDQRPDHRGEVVAGVELPAETWCSAVASVSAKGENHTTYFDGAVRLHDGRGYPDTAPGWKDDPRRRAGETMTDLSMPERRAGGGLTSKHREIVRFCAIECEMQRSGERSVHWMFEAWNYALERTGLLPTEVDVLALGELIEPRKNARGYRQVPVQIGGDVLADWGNIPRQMSVLMENAVDLTPDSFFYRYEKVHPFVDGNGRTGQVLFNWLLGTLETPEWAPNFFEDPRRVAGDGA